MTNQNDFHPTQDLTEDEVFRIISIIEKFDPIVVGGQAINLWVNYIRGRLPGFLGDGAFASKDVDFYRNSEAAERLADELNGHVYIPDSEDSTPNAAVVVGRLGRRQITVDFMAMVLGVESRSLMNNQVAISAWTPNTNRAIRILLLHPLDCLRSRLANINILNRNDRHSLNQAFAAEEVLIYFIDYLLRDPNRLKHIQTILIDLSYTIREMHAGKPSHLIHGLNPARILDAFQSDERLDPRWRSGTLAPARDRALRWLSSAEDRSLKRSPSTVLREAVEDKDANCPSAFGTQP